MDKEDKDMNYRQYKPTLEKKESYDYLGKYIIPEPVIRPTREKKIRTPAFSSGIKIITSSQEVEQESHRKHKCKPFIKKKFRGLFSNSGDNPIVEGIICGNKMMYFGLINRKLVTFTVFSHYDARDKKTKRDVSKHNFEAVYGFEEVSEENNNREYVRAVARKKLTDLIKKEIAIEKRAVHVHTITNWAKFKLTKYKYKKTA